MDYFYSKILTASNCLFLAFANTYVLFTKCAFDDESNNAINCVYFSNNLSTVFLSKRSVSHLELFFSHLKNYCNLGVLGNKCLLRNYLWHTATTATAMQLRTYNL